MLHQTQNTTLDPETLEAVRGFLVVERSLWRTAIDGMRVAGEIDRCIRWCEAEQNAAQAELDASLDDRIAITPAGLAALAVA